MKPLGHCCVALAFTSYQSLQETAQQQQNKSVRKQPRRQSWCQRILNLYYCITLAGALNRSQTLGVLLAQASLEQQGHAVRYEYFCALPYQLQQLR
jgi:nitric oxide reductase large subunit